ncbi:A/G-specific adenine glycosylase [Pseudohoeflea suaedae]|uniref:Adenine DNA glycosylase n=1 Tax=Pseudohoeflea suaedae TaxID=877384 RepID=A0A4R5PPB7_9HYPH|nr:A/G-specific adenine glycosylase [Pseudohoeflea suaedae]TDH38703.1 A/G-specific adenine glycosylase [Pseudohoeflea suaedae]
MTSEIAPHLLAWYDRHHRSLPWRVTPADRAAGVVNDPYAVWLSEIMLQQTTVKAVRPYYERFLERWPTVTELASAEDEDVMRLWAGLGYYSRARNLIACARTVAGDHGGRFPETAEGLSKLPGIGPYTAAAIAAIAFDESVAVVDGNVERVFTRLYAIDTPLPKAKTEIKARVSEALPKTRAGDFAQALMDLGATICTPRSPACAICPLLEDCEAGGAGNPEAFPVKPPKKAKPVRVGAAFVAQRPDGAVLLVRRPDKGLLGGMRVVPTTGWTARQDGATGTEAAPFPANWEEKGQVIHVFTHFELRLSVFHALVTSEDKSADAFDTAMDARWSDAADLAGEALPSVMKKALTAALPDALRPRKPGRD